MFLFGIVFNYNYLIFVILFRVYMHFKVKNKWRKLIINVQRHILLVFGYLVFKKKKYLPKLYKLETLFFSFVRFCSLVLIQETNLNDVMKVFSRLFETEDTRSIFIGFLYMKSLRRSIILIIYCIKLQVNLYYCIHIICC